MGHERKYKKERELFQNSDLKGRYKSSGPGMLLHV